MKLGAGKTRVVIESPYAGDVERNVAYARACLLDSLKLGEAPIASHLLYTQVLDDNKLDERVLGICAGFAWNAKADLVAVYTDLGISSGMKLGIELAEGRGIPVIHREVEGWSGLYDPLTDDNEMGLE